MYEDQEYYYHIAYNMQTKEVGLFTDKNQYKIARDTYTKGGRITPLVARSFQEAIDLLYDVITKSYTPTITPEESYLLKPIDYNQFISMDYLTKDIMDKRFKYAYPKREPGVIYFGR